VESMAYTRLRREEIANRYHAKADEVELAGFPRFASAMRGLAKNYERDARESQNETPSGIDGPPPT